VLVILQPYGNRGVLVLRQDSWRERLLGTCTKLGLKMLNANVSEHCPIFIGGKMEHCSETSAHELDAGESPRRKHTTFRTRRKFNIKNVHACLRVSLMQLATEILNLNLSCSMRLHMLLVLLPRLIYIFFRQTGTVCILLYAVACSGVTSYIVKTTASRNFQRYDVKCRYALLLEGKQYRLLTQGVQSWRRQEWWWRRSVIVCLPERRSISEDGCFRDEKYFERKFDRSSFQMV
jgi:hypothetical protein